FEQTYSEVEGDSAAVAELVAILSSLADVPVRQWLAVTGSINQLGEIQPIGGINEKIEGFFEACRKRGLTGKEGAIIPARNVKHLALSRAVVDAVASRQFSVFAVGTIDEAIEILTGLPAGERNMDGVYQPGTLYAQAAQRLQDMALAAAEWGNVEGQSHRRIITEG
ncbi:MAG TPA: S16 family serine protease, partial [Nitrospira sp.]|nr:S16 family serine protease [Nitrospira sp.]